MKIKQDRDYCNIGRNIRKFRLQSGLTQKQTVAKLQLRGIDISRGTYSHIECGLNNIRVDGLLILAEIFHVSVGAFFEDMNIQ